MMSTPLWLALLPLVGGLSLLAYRSGRRVAAGTRGIVLTLLVVALAGPSTPGPELGPVHVLVVDHSDSATRLDAPDLKTWRAALPDNAWVAVVGFARGARLLLPPVPLQALPSALDAPSADLPTNASHLAEALTLAAHTIPDGRTGTIHVATDGHTTTALDEALRHIAERGLGVKALPITAPDPGAPAVQSVVLPAQVDAGATVDAQITVWGGQARGQQEVVVTTSDGAVELGRVVLETEPSTSTTLTLPLSMPPDLPGGPAVVRTQLDGESLLTGIFIDKPPEVLVVYGDPRDGRHLSSLLEADGLRVTRVPARDAQLDVQPDLLVLAGPSAASLPDGFLQQLGSFVEDGGGLLTIAGPDAYAAGGWQHSPLAPLLPVHIDPDGAEKDDTAALLVVLDKSGSMARPAEDSSAAEGMVSGMAAVLIGGRPEGSKIRVAAEAAAATMSKLRDHDRIGVLAVDTLPYWALKMSPAGERERGAAQVRKISAGGGGMYVLTALDAAAVAMRAEEAPLRHILLLVDASDAGEQTRDVFGDVRGAVRTAASLRAEGITISIVGIGSTQSRDSAFLADLARTGGGRLKLTPDIRTVSALFTQEVERLVGSAVSEEAPIKVRVSGWHPALRGVDVAAAPPIWGWSEVRSRPQARHVLTTPEGAPVLSVWRRGLGQVAALTTDDGARWARGWPRWSDNTRLFTQLARDLARDRAGAEGALALVSAPAGLVLELSHQADSQQPTLTTDRSVRVTVDGAEVPPPVRTLTGVGQERAEIHAPPGSQVAVTLLDSSGATLDIATAIVPTPSEQGHRGVHSATLSRLSFAPRPQDPLRAPGRPLWPALLTVALLLLPLDAWARRRRAEQV